MNTRHSKIIQHGTKKYSLVIEDKHIFPFGQVTIHSYLPSGHGNREVVLSKALKEQIRTCPGQTKFESYLSPGQARIHFLFQPYTLVHVPLYFLTTILTVKHMKNS